MDEICKNCKFWSRDDNSGLNNSGWYGCCSNKKKISADCDGNYSYENGRDCMTGVFTEDGFIQFGESFGCIHWAEK